MEPKGRAKQEWQKRECINQILGVWLEHPELRLGQLLENSLGTNIDVSTQAPFFYMEDFDLTQKVIDFGNKVKK